MRISCLTFNSALISVCMLVAAPAWAGLMSIDFDITTNGNPVTDLFIYSTANGQEDIFAAPDIIASTGIQTLSHTLAFDPARALSVGINEGIGSEGAHIIMFTNELFAAGAIGLKWSELFAPMRHSQFITLLTEAHDGNAGSLAAVTDFFRSPAVVSAAFNPAGAASILQFSIVPPPIGGTVPEPGSIVLICIALGALALMRTKNNMGMTPAFQQPVPL